MTLLQKNCNAKHTKCFLCFLTVHITCLRSTDCSAACGDKCSFLPHCLRIMPELMKLGHDTHGSPRRGGNHILNIMSLLRP